MELDNQQRSLDEKLNWLGGIIDGEGMLTLIKRAGKGQEGYTPRISIVNTDLVLIEEVISICKEIQVPFYVQTHAGKGTWKTKYEVLFNGIKRCNTVIPHIKNKLISKKWKAELLQEYCDSRLSKIKGSEISRREHQIAELIRTGHTTGPKSNTLRDYTLNTINVKI